MITRSFTMTTPIKERVAPENPDNFFITTTLIQGRAKSPPQNTNDLKMFTISRQTEAGGTSQKATQAVTGNSNCRLQPGIRFYKALCNLSKPIAKYGLRIPETYYAEEGKLLVYDPIKECISHVDQVLDETFRNRLELEARLHSSQPDEPAYLFHKRNCTNPHDFSTTSELVTWRELPARIRSTALIEIYIQKYVKPNKGHKLVYRLNYFCNPAKCRKANYVEILAPFETSEAESKHWGYNPSSLTFLYKSYNGLSELELTAKKIAYLASLEYGCRLQQLQLDFIKEKEAEPKYWFVGLVWYCLDSDALARPLSPRMLLDTTEQTAPLKCGLCGEKYKRGEMDKLLPLKMLIDTRNHMEKRNLLGIFPPIQAPKRFSLMLNCRVCCTCYLIVVQENALIETETEMALAQSIPVSIYGPNPPSLYAIDDPNALLRPNAFLTHLYQWRSMLYAIKFSVFFLPTRK